MTTHEFWSALAPAVLGGAGCSAAITYGAMRAHYAGRLRRAVHEVELRSSAVQARLRAAHIQSLADLHEARVSSTRLVMQAIERERAMQARTQPLRVVPTVTEIPPAFADTLPMMGEFDDPEAADR